jgi:hypothetical protein
LKRRERTSGEKGKSKKENESGEKNLSKSQKKGKEGLHKLEV